MVAHGGFGGIGGAAGDARGDVLMRILRRFGLQGGVGAQDQWAGKQGAVVDNEAGDAGGVGGSSDSQMKSLVDAGAGLHVSGLGGAAGGGQAGDLALFGRRRVHGGEAGGDALDGFAQMVDFSDFGAGIDDGDAAAACGGKQAIGDEAGEGFANGGAADPEQGGDAQLGEAFAGFEVAGGDGVLEAFIGQR